MSTTGHRAGVFKKPAKPHKSWKGKRTKGEITADNRGREGVKEITRSHSTHRAVSKDARRNQLKMARERKMADAMERRRTSNAPCLVTVVSLGVGARPSEFIKKLATCDETIVQTTSPSTIDFAVSRFKSRISFLTPDKENVDAVLDAIRASDVLCFLWPLSAELSEWDEQLLTIIKAAGLPTIVSVVPGLGGIANHKKKEDVRKGIEFTISKWSMSSAGVLPADSVTDNLQLLRILNETKKKPLTLQSRHSYMLVENLDCTDKKEETCTLVAQGYLRGPEWNANNLIHLPGFGDFQVSRIETAQDPHPLKTSGKPHEIQVIATADDKRQSLETEITPDAMDGEQTWPTQEELEEADKEMRRVPKGTSSYQAAWILDDEDDDEDEDSDEDMDDEEDESAEEEDDEDGDEEMDLKSEAGETTASEMMFDDGIDEDINMAEVEKYRKERENAQWPDEVDTPMDQPARIRFQKYRGLKSFRTSTWDAKENLPLDYARIFQFANYKNTKKNVMSKIGGNDMDAGDSVISKKFNGAFASVFIENVPLAVLEAYKDTKNLVLFQLLPHEQKMSVLNMVLKKHPSCTVPITSEEQKFIFYVGFRQFEANAVFSSNTPGDKFKLERFMPAEKTFVATVYAPIIFNPATVLCFRQDDKGRQELVATGSVLDTNPDRIVLKRTVLSGHPYKINRRAVVVRYMFFNREDIEWFKPVELYTPSGRRGHIKEAVGTHGHMKCRFDQQLNAQDSVMLNLYKRVFPVWNYSLFNRNLNPSRFVERSRVESISLVNEDAMEE
ncbi:hypothetical protein CAEBREN_23625 [Caenorhabditis brenneri]|uniref:Pre-rRNA-processing protein TSR1 homolog n=1 Tax=Caenorhabditis brenneri TaxID=135651 RepID=G0P849_CAEBE|nr:hypothetical protein CAEBREN_23625 [Caenorhabditis brenneri]